MELEVTIWKQNAMHAALSAFRGGSPTRLTPSHFSERARVEKRLSESAEKRAQKHTMHLVGFRE